MKITIDSRSGAHNQDIEIFNAEIDKALTCLRKLDGMNHTLMIIERSDSFQLVIGGGRSFYVVTLDGGFVSKTLKNVNSVEPQTVELCAGGQYGEYPAYFCVDETQVSKIISLFFQDVETEAVWV